MSDKPNYSSYDEVRDRLAMRQAMTLQQTSHRAGYYAGLGRIISRGKEAAERLAEHGKLNTRYGTPGTNRPVQQSTRKRS